MQWHPLYLLFLLFDFVNNRGKNELYLKQTWIIISFKLSSICFSLGIDMCTQPEYM